MVLPSMEELSVLLQAHLRSHLQVVKLRDSGTLITLVLVQPESLAGLASNWVLKPTPAMDTENTFRLHR